MAVEIPNDLLAKISDKRASLFLGAGASCEANFPSTCDLSKYLAMKAGSPHYELLANQTLDRVAQYLYKQPGYGKQWVRQEIIKYLNTKHDEHPPSAAHIAMTGIQWSTIFTTNYDRLIEIAYDTSKDAVQRALPIYTYNPAILYKESDSVRVIKLNGSVDEAARNSSHELVLTFAEQQDSLSRNKELYRLLCEEAINGPIIFIGFRFIHPGASSSGTSPEFLHLREIMRNMGTAARWHYCVSSFDASSFETQLDLETLRDNNIHVINATFGEFFDALSLLLKKTLEPLASRPSIVIPVGKTDIQIPADEYEKDKRHFEILGNYMESIEVPSVTESLNGQETWGSFLSHHFIERSCTEDLRNILIKAANNAPKIILIGAPPGWGKTFLLRNLAVSFYQERRPVIWLNQYGTLEYGTSKKGTLIVGKWDSVRIRHILSMIADASGSNSDTDTTPIIIADNCPERAEEVLYLFRELSDIDQLFVIVFAVRDHELESLIKEYPVFNKAIRFCPTELYDSKAEVRSLIDFCAKHGVATIEGATNREVIAQRIIKEEADTAIILALQVIFDKEHRPFSEIIKSLWESLNDNIEQELITQVASLHRFGSAFFPRLYSVINTFPAHDRYKVLEAYRSCLDKRILFENVVQEEPCIRTLHSLVSEHLLKVCGKQPSVIDRKLLDLIACMTGKIRDLEITRRLLKRITDYEISLSSAGLNEELFQVAAQATNYDFVVCQQSAKYMLQRGEYEQAFAWIERALEDDPDNPSLQHTKGNVLRQWAIELLSESKSDEAESKIREAKQCFAFSRVKGDLSEYGYVTHLDMLSSLLKDEQDKLKQASLRAEGALLYREGIRRIPQDRFKYLLEERFQRNFDLQGYAIDELCYNIEQGIAKGKVSAHAAAFLAQELYRQKKYTEAIEILRKQNEISEDSVRIWVKEAEIHARESNFSEAMKCIDMAKRKQKDAEDKEVLWSLRYWDLIIATALENFGVAQEANLTLIQSRFFSGLFSTQRFPRGYFWRKTAKNVEPEERSLRNYAKIWSGRIEAIRSGEGQYGRVALTNFTGETLYVDFNPRYFNRNLRSGEFINFAITILPNRIRAENLDLNPFRNTVDDIFL